MPAGTRPRPPVDTVRVTVHGVNATHATVNVLWLKVVDTGTKTQNDLAGIIDALAAAWNTRFSGQLANTFSVIRFDAVWLTDTDTELIYSKSVSFVGTVSPSLNDASACFVVKWLISAYYRGGHPRMYLPGISSADITNGSDIGSTRLSSLAAGAAGFRNDVNALTSGAITSTQLGTVSFQTGHSWRTPPLFRQFIGAAVNPKLGTQRRRIHS